MTKIHLKVNKNKDNIHLKTSKYEPNKVRSVNFHAKGSDEMTFIHV